MLSEFEKYIADTGLAKVKAFYTENVSIKNDRWKWYLLN